MDVAPKPDTDRTVDAVDAVDPNCPPLAQWPVIANMRVWSSVPSDDVWKTIRKCPHCGTLREQLQTDAG